VPHLLAKKHLWVRVLIRMANTHVTSIEVKDKGLDTAHGQRATGIGINPQKTTCGKDGDGL